MLIKFRRITILKVLVTMVLGYLILTAIDSERSIVFAAKNSYSGVFYVSGMGGHFAKIDVMIDPNNSDDPI